MILRLTSSSPRKYLSDFLKSGQFLLASFQDRRLGRYECGSDNIALARVGRLQKNNEISTNPAVHSVIDQGAWDRSRASQSTPDEN